MTPVRSPDDFAEYTLLDAAGGERLESWNGVVLIRPEPQAVWSGPREHPLWSRPHAVYHRSDRGGGAWETLKPVPEDWSVGYRGMRFRLRLMGFKHTGLFPEQAANWNRAMSLISGAGRAVRALNLFAYTGAASVACLKAGASVTHVDAAKGMVRMAKDNAALSGLADRPARWLQDDCLKFLAREGRRGGRYDAVILDPPVYGRGPGGELWRLEEQIEPLLRLVAGVLCERPLFVLLNTYTSGISPTVFEFLIKREIAGRRGKIFTEELGLPVRAKDVILPCGYSTWWINDAE